jgi:hypothetical protein
MNDSLAELVRLIAKAAVALHVKQSNCSADRKRNDDASKNGLEKSPRNKDFCSP